jgi:hypothetical protein
MHPSEHSKAARLFGPIGLALFTLLGILLLSTTGLPGNLPAFLGPFSVVLVLVGGGGMAALYLLGAFGLGRPLAALLAPSSQSRTWLQLALGLATMLWLSHALGLAGALSGTGVGPRIIGWLPVALGLVLLIDQVARGRLRPEHWPVLPVASILWAPGLALLIVAAANPTGGLWGGPTGTEYNAFDSLEYHLQLPKEWAAGPRLWPSDHNVYSYLPSFIEAAFLHVGALMLGGEKSNDPITRLLAGPSNEGNWVIACQYLHAGIAIIGALLTARTASVLIRRVRGLLPGAAGSVAAAATNRPEGASNSDDPSTTTLGIIAGAFTLCTPWMIVVSSLPYNDAAVTTLAAGGLLIALDDRIPIGRRALLAGWAAGVACGCKPTALFMAGPVVGLFLLANMHVRSWPRAILCGSAAGLLAVIPWLWRNWAASGNPVYPFGAKLFGTGHWTAEQVERHNRNHHAPPDLHAGGRIARLFSEKFGLLHPQWGMLLAALAVALIVALAWRPTRRFAALLAAAILAQCACWMILTHLQSRFLLPIITPAALLIALAGSALLAWIARSGESRTKTLCLFAILVLSLIPLDHARRSIVIFLEQNDEHPNFFLVEGVGGMIGLSGEAKVATPDERERAEEIAKLAPNGYINLILRPQDRADSGVYLLGDSTPLYLLGASGSGPIIYNTTWDTPLIVKIKQSAGDDPAAWSLALRKRGIRYILVDFSELLRYIERDHNYDPNITTSDIASWITSPSSHLKSIRAWRPATAPPLTGIELFEIDLPPQQNPATTQPQPTLQDRLR